LTCLCGLMG